MADIEFMLAACRSIALYDYLSSKGNQLWVTDTLIQNVNVKEITTRQLSLTQEQKQTPFSERISSVERDRSLKR